MKFQISIIILYTLVSCQTYTTKTLTPIEIFQQLEQEKGSINIKSLSFSDAVKIMSDNNFKIKRLKYEYQKYLKLSKIKTPLPNPIMNIGRHIHLFSA